MLQQNKKRHEFSDNKQHRAAGKRPDGQKSDRQRLHRPVLVVQRTVHRGRTERESNGQIRECRSGLPCLRKDVQRTVLL